jgi:hypothetical protein
MPPAAATQLPPPPPSLSLFLPPWGDGRRSCGGKSFPSALERQPRLTRLRVCGQLGTAVAELQAELAAAAAAGSAATARREQLQAKAASLQTEMKEFTAQRESRLAAAEKRLKAAKASLGASRDAAKDLTVRRANNAKRSFTPFAYLLMKKPFKPFMRFMRTIWS